MGMGACVRAVVCAGMLAACSGEVHQESHGVPPGYGRGGQGGGASDKWDAGVASAEDANGGARSTTGLGAAGFVPRGSSAGSAGAEGGTSATSSSGGASASGG